MDKRNIVILGIVLGIILVAYLVMAYSTYGAPSEFGNATTTTCWVGGDDGILNCTGNAKIEGNVIFEQNLTFGDNDYICMGDSGCSDSYIVFNSSCLIIKVN